MGAVDQPLELRLTAPRTSSPLAQDYAELQEALRTYGIDASVSYAQQMLRKHDKDGSGLMEILEFAQLCRELPNFIAEGYRQDYETLQAQLGSGNPGSQDEELSRLRASNRDLRAQLDGKDRRGYGDGGGRDGYGDGGGDRDYGGSRGRDYGDSRDMLDRLAYGDAPRDSGDSLLPGRDRDRDRCAADSLRTSTPRRRSLPPATPPPH